MHRLVGLGGRWGQSVTKQTKHNIAPKKQKQTTKGNDPDSDTDSDNQRFCNTSTNWARFLVVESSSDDLPLGRLSPFVIQQGFQAIAGALKGIKKLKDGSFLVECSRKQQAMGLLKTTRFINRPVRVSIHKELNSLRGVIRCRELSP